MIMAKKEQKTISKAKVTTKKGTKPMANKTAKPVAKKLVKPVAKKAAKPIAKKLVKPLAKKAAKPLAKKPVKPIAKKAAKPVAKKLVKPVAKKAAKPVAKKLVKPVAKKAAKPLAKKLAKPVAKKAAKPVAKKLVKPVAKKVAKPIAKKPIKPVAKKVAKPVVKNITTNIAQKKSIPPVLKSEKITASAAKLALTTEELKAANKIPFEKHFPLSKKEAKPKEQISNFISEKPIKAPIIGKTKFSDAELAEFKNLITKKIDEAVKDYELLKDTLSHRDNNGTDDTSPTFKLLEDGSEVMSKEETTQLAIRQEKFIQNLKNALIRIENRTYGVCRATGKMISKDRLRSVPHATLSIEAKREQN